MNGFLPSTNNFIGALGEYPIYDFITITSNNLAGYTSSTSNSLISQIIGIQNLTANNLCVNTINSHSGSITTINGEISTLQTEVATNTADIATNTATISVNTAAIGTLSTTVGANTTAISGLITTVAGKANTSSFQNGASVIYLDLIGNCQLGYDNTCFAQYTDGGHQDLTLHSTYTGLPATVSGHTTSIGNLNTNFTNTSNWIKNNDANSSNYIGSVNNIVSSHTANIVNTSNWIKTNDTNTSNYIKTLPLSVWTGSTTIYTSATKVGINTSSAPATYALEVNGDVSCINLRGNGNNITGINASTGISTGTLGANYGGTGCTSLSSDFTTTSSILALSSASKSKFNISGTTIYTTNTKVGINTSSAPASYELEVNGTVSATNLRGAGGNITAISATNISAGILSASYGGTGCTSLSSTYFTTTGGVLSLTGIGGGTQWTGSTSIYFNGSVGINTNATPTVVGLDLYGGTGFDASCVLRLYNQASQYGRTKLYMVGRYEGGNDAWGFNSRNVIVFGSQSSLNSAITDNAAIQSYNGQLGLFTAGYSTSTPLLYLTSTGVVDNGTLTTNGYIYTMNTGGVSAPSTGTCGAGTGGDGTKLVLYPGGSGAYPYALGINGSELWYNVPSGAHHQWYISGTSYMNLTANSLTVYGGSGNGYVLLNGGGSGSGTASHCGYVGFYSADGQRKGYCGWNGNTAGYLSLETENGYSGWEVSGNLIVDGTKTVKGCSYLNTSPSQNVAMVLYPYPSLPYTQQITTNNPVFSINTINTWGGTGQPLLTCKVMDAYNSHNDFVSLCGGGGCCSGWDFTGNLNIDTSYNTNYRSAYNVGTTLTFTANSGNLVFRAYSYGTNGATYYPFVDCANYTGTQMNLSGPVICSYCQQTSDEKTKTNIQKLDNSLDKIMKIHGRKYRSKIDDTDHIGFIAQELESIIPECVRSYVPSAGYSSNLNSSDQNSSNLNSSNIETPVHPSSDIKGILYSNLVALTIEGIKELNDNVIALTKRVSYLEDIITSKNL